MPVLPPTHISRVKTIARKHPVYVVGKNITAHGHHIYVMDRKVQTAAHKPTVYVVKTKTIAYKDSIQLTSHLQPFAALQLSLGVNTTELNEFT